MNIVIIGPAHPFRGGIALFTERLAQQFISEGHQVHVVTFTTQYPHFLFPGKTQFSEEKAPTNISISRKINSVSPLNWWKVGNFIKKQRPDLLIFNYWMPFFAPCFGIIAQQVKKNRHTKCFSLAHNIIPHEKRFGDQLLTKFFVTKMDGFTVLSEKVKSDLKTIAPSTPVEVTPHPLYDNFGAIKNTSLAKRSLGLQEDIHYLLFFGLIRKYKGLDTLITAFAQQQIDKSKIHLLIAGEFYDDKKLYLDLIKKYKLDNFIHIVDKFVPDNEVADYFSAADMVVQPYKTATQSGVTQIAYHFNTPMLVTDVGGLKEMIPHEKVGYVVAPTPLAVAEAIADFYQNNRSEGFINGIIEEKQKYSWENISNAFLSLAQQ